MRSSARNLTKEKMDFENQAAPHDFCFSRGNTQNFGSLATGSKSFTDITIKAPFAKIYKASRKNKKTIVYLLGELLCQNRMSIFRNVDSGTFFSGFEKIRRKKNRITAEHV